MTACTGGAFASDKDASQTHNEQGPTLQLKPRYYRWFVDPGTEWTEANTRYATLDWEVPLSQCALVLVDVWDAHYLKDTEARAEHIIRERFLPLLAACRKAGLTIIHAPSPPQAKRHPNWVGPVETSAKSAEEPQRQADWPPRDFRSKSGQFGTYAKPPEPRNAERQAVWRNLSIHPLVMPWGDEPVVADGDELHAYCHSQGILFLLYAGFNTNACILGRDYGTLAMDARGYDVIILRDCGTGMESFETTKDLGQTQNTILMLEMFGRYSVDSEALIKGLPAD